MEEAMSDTTSDFFDGLARRGHDPSLEKATGTMRFDLTDHGKTTHWNVKIAKGDLSVSRENGEPDCVIFADKQVFESIVAGEVSPLAAMLRGTVGLQGDQKLAVLFRRLLTEVPS
jgi:putative sterol carrier protein